MRPRLTAAMLVVACVALGAESAASATTLEPIGTFDQPVDVVAYPGDESRVVVVQLGGRVALVDDGVASTFLDLSSTGAGLVFSDHSRGMLSVALAPDFATSGRLYAFYSGAAAAGGTLGDLYVDEFHAVGDVVDPETRRRVLTIDPPAGSDHNGGRLLFGPDGLLYLSTGDGGGGGDPLDSGQDIDSLLGKILRIDPRPGETTPYSIPPSNPFVGAIPGRDEIWSLGLRNPFRYSFDRLTGALVIGDVGQDGWDEVNYVAGPDAGRGANFGWDCFEGAHPYSDPSPVIPCPGSGFTEPVYEYGHTVSAGVPLSGGCSITGGQVVRDPSLGDLEGRYLFADLCSGAVASLVPGQSAVNDGGSSRSRL